VRIVRDLSSPPWPGDRAVVTIGAYDGVHRGHRSVISAVVEAARAEGRHSAVVTFDRHPAAVVRPESAPLLLTDLEQKLELLALTGVDATVVVPFDGQQAAEEPADFVARVLVRGLGVGRLIVGADFHFGKNRAGNVALLTELGRQHDFQVGGLPLLSSSGATISSTAIRRALKDGEVEVAASMLDRPYEVRGVVVRGDQRGRTIGFPTANVEVPNTICLPADGVYAGWYELPSGDVCGAVMNLGRRPTFYEHADHSLLEAHLLDFDGDLYGQAAKVRFVRRVRGERKFDGLDALREQISADRVSAATILAE
jgi:riboflavin kinase / FMN adenylyltransferase